MSSSSPSPAATTPMIGAQAVVASLMQGGVTRGFGVPSIHNWDSRAEPMAWFHSVAPENK